MYDEKKRKKKDFSKCLSNYQSLINMKYGMPALQNFIININILGLTINI